MDNKIVLARTQMRAGNVDAAQRIAHDILSHDIENAEALCLAYDCAVLKHEYDGALKISKQWIEVHPDDEAAHYFHAMSLLNIHDISNYEAAFAMYTQTFPHEADKIKMFGALAAYRTGRHWKAEKPAQSLREKMPADLSILDLCICIAYARGKIFSVRRLCEKYIEDNQSNPRIWVKYAAGLMYSLQFSKARKAARQAIKLDPKIGSLKFFMAMTRLAYLPCFWPFYVVMVPYLYLSQMIGGGLTKAIFTVALMIGIPLLLNWSVAHNLDELVGIIVVMLVPCGLLFVLSVPDKDVFNNKVKTIKLSDY